MYRRVTMNEFTVRFLTNHSTIDPGFWDHLQIVAEKYGLFFEENTRLDMHATQSDSADLVREGRDWLDRRDAERAAGGFRSDLSHINNL